ncbi:MAG: hypothetical protein RLZZ30_1872, partial [Bacteroidota bacterium]
MLLSHSFQNQKDTAFGETVRQRVTTHLKQQHIQPLATTSMVLKTLVLFLTYLGIYAVLLLNPWKSVVQLFACYGSLGLLLGVIGMNIMHDKVHGAYAKHPIWNFLLEIPILCIGLESKIWYIEHNVLHHNYTNVEGLDHDIHHRFVFRFSENQPKRWFHRFQFLYAPFIYGLLLFEWLSVKDFIKVIQYRKKGLIQSQREAILLFLQILIKKSFFHAIFLLLPLLLINMSPWLILSGYMFMLVCGGFFMTMVFQLAHIVPNLKFVATHEVNIPENWYIHQLQTTSNFALGNRFVTAAIGGLNYQIEHHLFPDMPALHYLTVAPQVQAIAKKYGIA